MLIGIVPEVLHSPKVDRGERQSSICLSRWGLRSNFHSHHPGHSGKLRPALLYRIPWFSRAVASVVLERNIKSPNTVFRFPREIRIIILPLSVFLLKRPVS